MSDFLFPSAGLSHTEFRDLVEAEDRAREVADEAIVAAAYAKIAAKLAKE